VTAATFTVALHESCGRLRAAAHAVRMTLIAAGFGLAALAAAALLAAGVYTEHHHAPDQP
jgi:hypothetical protein